MDKQVSTSDNLPRLLYWADLPVAPTSAGAILMLRLLEEYPAEKLLICTPRALANDCLPDVKKIEPPRAPLEFLFHSRFAYVWMTVLTLWGMILRVAARGRAPRWMASAVEEFAPQAILTVGIDGAWMGADALSRHLKIPLHLIVHDDHHYSFFWIPSLRAWGERLFGKAYRRASSRLCISEPMEREYLQRFGVSGQVLLPSRGRDSLWFGAPRCESADQTFSSTKVFYAGSVYGSAFEQLESIAQALAAYGHRLVVFTLSRPPSNFRPMHVDLRAALPSSELVKRLHEEADILLLLSDFDSGHRETLRTLFPSKMVDYTAAAVAILVVAPEDSCIASYLKSRPLAGQLLSNDAPGRIAEAIDCLARSLTRRQQLAEGAVRAGKQDFSYKRAFARFCDALGRDPDAVSD